MHINMSGTTFTGPNFSGLAQEDADEYLEMLEVFIVPRKSEDKDLFMRVNLKQV